MNNRQKTFQIPMFSPLTLGIGIALHGINSYQVQRMLGHDRAVAAERKKLAKMEAGK
jgi:hypothetical protein